MAGTNTILNSDVITKEALRVLHEKLNAIGRVNRQYDSSFSASGAKNGTSLRIRKPARFTARTGSALSVQNFEEESKTLSMTSATQYGVDLDFSSIDMTLSLDDFSSRVIEPAMAQLAAEVESAFLNYAVANVGNVVFDGTGLGRDNFLTAAAYLDNNSVPRGKDRTALVDPMTQATLANAGSALFNDQKELGREYLEGTMGQFGGFAFYSNPFMPTIAIGTSATGTVNDTVVSGDQEITLAGLGNAQVIKAGTAFTVAGVNAVQYETKGTLSYLKQFVVAADATATSGGDVTVTLSEPIVSTGASKNVSALPANSAVVTILGTGSTTNTVCLAFHKDAFVFASADLVVPGGTDKASRQVYDGISMRFISDYDISNDLFVCRFDLLAGWVATRPESAVTIQD